ncbi:hypothetical protein [Caenimonas sp. SL110]|uniref:hypothetical protein n=1 Tax=Caenimonas sp. SL110 TaxID=1450524 RepID=UPI000653EFB8|nr:hypothetical protein [Caenimonas sp. SL110]
MSDLRVNESSPRTSVVSDVYPTGPDGKLPEDNQAADALSFPKTAAPQQSLERHWTISDSNESQQLLSRSEAPPTQGTAGNLGATLRDAVRSIRMPYGPAKTSASRRKVVPVFEHRDAPPMTELIRQHDQTYASILAVTQQIGATKPRNSSREAIDEANRRRNTLKTQLETLKVVRSMQDATMAREGESWGASLSSSGLQGHARADLEKRIAAIEAFRASTQAAIDTADIEIAKARQPRNWTVEAGDEARIESARLEQSKVNLVRTLEAIDAERASLAARWTWVAPHQSVPLPLQSALPVEHEIDG